MKLPVVLALLIGMAIGGVVSAVIFAPTKAKVDMLTYSAVRLGWLCHDNDVDFDNCALIASGNDVKKNYPSVWDPSESGGTRP